MNAARILPMAAVLVALVGASGCGVSKMTLGPAGSARVWGTVLDRTAGTPVAGVSIWSPPSSATTTDRDGQYSLLIQWDHGNPTVDAGSGCKVNMIVAKAGYVPTYPAIICGNGTSYEEDIKLDAIQ